MFGRTGCFSRLGVAVSGLASLVGEIYRLVGMCSGARKFMSFVLGEKTYRVMSYLYVNVRATPSLLQQPVRPTMLTYLLHGAESFLRS